MELNQESGSQLAVVGIVEFVMVVGGGWRGVVECDWWGCEVRVTKFKHVYFLYYSTIVAKTNPLF